MKHGRPEVYEDYDRVWYSTVGWRREHAHRVWQAMAAVVSVMEIQVMWAMEMAVIRNKVEEIHAEAKKRGMT